MVEFFARQPVAPWHQGSGATGMLVQCCTAMERYAHYRRDRAHLKMPQTHTSPSRFECLNVERLKESRFVAWKPQHFGKVLPCMEFKHGNTRGPHPLGKAPLRGPSSDSSAFRFHTYFRMFITARAGLLHLLYPIVAFACHFEIQEEHVKRHVFFVILPTPLIRSWKVCLLQTVDMSKFHHQASQKIPPFKYIQICESLRSFRWRICTSRAAPLEWIAALYGLWHKPCSWISHWQQSDFEIWKMDRATNRLLIFLKEISRSGKYNNVRYTLFPFWTLLWNPNNVWANLGFPCWLTVAPGQNILKLDTRETIHCCVSLQRKKGVNKHLIRIFLGLRRR